MTKAIPRHTFNETLPATHWNDAADSIEQVWPNGARTVKIGQASDSTLYEHTWDWCNVKHFGAAGDGTTDDTAAIAAAFTAADAEDRAVFFPPGVYLTSTINYKMQSVVGTHKTECKILGMPGQDVFNVDPTVGQFYKQAGLVSNITILVDNSVDATGTFTWRVGADDLPVGNAGYAIDYNDRLDPSPPLAIDWVWQNVEIKGVASNGVTTTNGGANNTCGIYSQSNHFSQCYFNNINIGYNTFGWMDHWPTINTTSGTNGRDHCIVDNIHFIRNSYHWKTVNWGIFDICNPIFHGGAVIGGWEMKGVTTSSTPNFHNGHITSMEMAGATEYGLKTDSSVRDLIFENCAINGTPVDTFNGSDCRFFCFTYTPTSEPNPRLIIAGHRNFIELEGVGSVLTNDYKHNRVEDQGVGNQIFITEHIGSSSDLAHRRSSITPDGMWGHARDAVSPMLGIHSPMFMSGNDLLVNPRTLRTSAAHVENTDFEYLFVSDDSALADTEFRCCLRRLDTGARTIAITSNILNGPACFIVGKYLPPTKVTVYICSRLAVASTVTYTLKSATFSKGAATSASVGTSWTVTQFEADLTGEAAGAVLELDGAAPANGATGMPHDIAWIMFRPWFANLNSVGPLTSSAYVAKTANYTATKDDDRIDCDATSGAITITLPAVASTKVGKTFTIKKTDATNNVVVDGNASETIDGATTKTITTQWGCLKIYNTGANWRIEHSIGTIT